MGFGPEDYKPLRNRINIVISKNHYDELKFVNKEVFSL